MERLRSSVASGLSWRSDQSKDQPPKFSDEERSSTLDSLSFRSRDSGYAPSRSASSVPSDVVLCDVCPAVKSCLDCRVSFCETHVKHHYSTLDRQRHQHQDLCVEHHRMLEFYCRTDQLAICSCCLLYNHRSHDVIEQKSEEISSKSITRNDVPPPGQIEFTEVNSDSVYLSWSPPEDTPGPHRFRVMWGGGGKQDCKIVTELGVKVKGLIPGEKYYFAVATLTEDDHQSSVVEGTLITDVPPPENLTVDLRSLTAFLKWTKPSGVDQVSYLLELFRDEECIDTLHAHAPSCNIPGLQCGAGYTISVSTILKNNRRSKPSSHFFITGPICASPEDLRIVLVGKSGTGKSTSGNTILGRKVFEVKHSNESVTSQCEMARGEVDGRRLCVIDTPSVDYTDFSETDNIREIERCMSLSSPGPHVFLVVIQVGRFTQLELEMTKKFQKIFGNKTAKYTIVLFTFGDALKKITIEAFLGLQQELSEYVAECGGRYHVFNNSQPENRSQVTELLQKIDEMVAENRGGYYTTEMLQQVKKSFGE